MLISKILCSFIFLMINDKYVVINLSKHVTYRQADHSLSSANHHHNALRKVKNICLAIKQIRIKINKNICLLRTKTNENHAHKII